MVRSSFLQACLVVTCTLSPLAGCNSNSEQAGQGKKDVPPELSISRTPENSNPITNVSRPASLSLANPRKIDRTPKKYRALLIGCTRYDDRSIRPLRGPVNDVELMRDVLIDEFKFRPENSSIVILSETAGLENLDLRPTRENIVRQFENLTEAAYEEGAHVVILFSGHGARQRDTDGDEVDGFDEVFCPADVVRLSADGGVGKGGISDDEIHGWLARISEHASIWLIADSCHNGTLTRGGESDGIDVPRTIEPSRSVHEESHHEYQSVHELAASVASVHANETSRSISSGKAKHPIVAFYAAPPTLETYDTQFNGVPHGLFTYTMCKVIRKSKGRLSYRKLIQGVFDEYVKMRRESPTPQIEAVNQDIEVLGYDELLGSDIQLRRSTAGYSVTAGRLHEVTEGTILAVYGGDADRDSKGRSEGDGNVANPARQTGPTEVDSKGKPVAEPRGYVRVVSAEMLQSQVEPCSYRGVKWEDPTSLTDCYCKVACANFQGLRQLAVAVDSQTVSGLPLSDEAREQWQAAVDRTNSDGKSLVKVVDQLHQADWIVQVADPEAPGIVYLATSKRFRQQADQRAAFISPPSDDVKETEQWLQLMLNDVARTCNLVEIAQHELKKSSEQIGLDVELRWRGVDGEYEQQVDASPNLKIEDGRRLGVYVRNPNPFAVYVTVLFVNSKCQTKAWLPRSKYPNNRLEKSGKEGDWFLPVKFTVNAGSDGLDRVVVIAVKERPQGQQPDLTFLASRTLEWTRSKGDDPKQPLEELLAASVFGATRDGELEEDEQKLDDHTFRVLSWQTVKTTEEGKGLFGGPQVGPPEDLGATIVEVDRSRYHTVGSSRARLGTYGELVRGKVLQYEPYTQIAGLNRVRWSRTIDKVGRDSGNALLSIAGQGRAWQILNFSGEVTGEHEREINFEVLGTRLDQADVVEALRRDPRAMNYFLMLAKTDGVPVVILENITLPRFEATRRQSGSGNAAAQVSYTDNGGSGRFQGERTSFVAFRSPVIRAYQMYEVKLAYVKYRDPQGLTRTQLKVIKLDPIPPKH